MDKLDECNDRVNSRSNTSEICVEELIDFVHCVDHCVSWCVVGVVIFIPTGCQEFVPEVKVICIVQYFKGHSTRSL